jgi:hypothetical protein
MLTRALVRMWLRVLPILAVAFFMTGTAHAQAPPSSFYDGRSNDELRTLASSRHNDVLLRRVAATRLVLALADKGDFDAADAAAREFASNIDPQAISHVRVVRRRSRVHGIALGALGASLGIALLRLVAGFRLLPAALRAVRRIALLATCFFLYCGLAGGYLASNYENGSPIPFELFAAFMLPLAILFRMWGAVGSPRTVARVGRSVAAVAATLAVGFLVVEHVNPAFLEGFGL